MIFTPGEIVFYLPFILLAIFGCIFVWAQNTPERKSNKNSINNSQSN